jgi:hypothetical protein
MAPPKILTPISNTGQLNLALQALDKDATLSIRQAAAIYEVPYTTLHRRRNGIASKRDQTAKTRKLTNSEEEAIVNQILDLNSKGMPPRVVVVRDMADELLRTRNSPPVGDKWTYNFIQRQPRLKSALTRRYDDQRAQCEDPIVIQKWFDLIRKTIEEYGIVEDDEWNFDEAGFAIGLIDTYMAVTGAETQGRPKAVQPSNREWVTLIQGVNARGRALPAYLVVKGKNHLASWYEERILKPDWKVHVSENGWTTNDIGLDWIKHFDQHTKDQKVGVWRLLILDGHESHYSWQFEQYCKENKILTRFMPPHSSHLLQPLDVGVFSPLKKAYGKEIEKLMRAQITHITKEDFFAAFRAASDAAITESNIQGGFRGAGLVPLDAQRVISRLDVKLSTPISSRPSSRSSQPWVSQTPKTDREAAKQLHYLKARISRHQSSSPTKILESMDQLERGIQGIQHAHTLLRAQLESTREANRLLSKRRRAKKTRLRSGASLSQQEAQDLQTQKDVSAQIKQEDEAIPRPRTRVERGARRCGACGGTGHNARTCDIEVESTGEEDSE